MQSRTIQKSVSLLLAAILAVQCVIGVCGAEAGGESYAGTVLAAVNTDYFFDDEKAFSPAEEAEDAVQNAETAQLSASVPVHLARLLSQMEREIEPMTPQQAQQTAAQADDTVEAQGLCRPYRVGDRKRVKVLAESSREDAVSSILSTINPSAVNVACAYVSERCTIWTAEDCAWTQEDVQSLAEFAEDAIPKMEDLFGTPRIDTDGDGKVALVVHSMRDGELGYFSLPDLIDKRSRIGEVYIKPGVVNRMGSAWDCLHITDSKEYTLEEIHSTFVHEYQHYIQDSYLFAGKTNADVLSQTDTYVNEGFSLASQMILCMPDSILDIELGFFHGADPQVHSLVYWDSMGRRSDQYELVNYGMSFVFFQYIRTRYALLTGDTAGEFPGRGIYKRVLQARNRSNQDNTMGIIADILYPAQDYPSLADTDARCRQLIVDFWLAVYLNEPNSIHGFLGESWAQRLHVKVCDSVEPQQICSAMAGFYLIDGKRNGSVTIKSADENLRLMTVDAPSRQVTFDMNGGFGERTEMYTVERTYRLTGEETAPPYRAGYIFEGWASLPDADVPECRTGDVIPPGNALTFYAVWREAEQMAQDVPHALTAEDGAQVQFTPPRDGVYYIDCAASFEADVYNPREALRETLADSADGVFLHAGEVYTVAVSLRGDDPQPETFVLKRRDTYYTLRLVADPQTDTPWACLQYGTTYALPQYDEQVDAGIVRWGYDFRGWSQQREDETPAYLPGERVTITADTVLYAVWKPWDALRTDEPYTADGSEIRLQFSPQKTASYRLECTAPEDEERKPAATLYDADGKKLYPWRDGKVTYTFNAGQTYYIRAKRVGKICLRFVSDDCRHTVHMSVSGLFLSQKIRTQGAYVLPDYRPIGLLGKEFVGWENVETDEILQPGDTVYVDHDILLRAVNIEVDEPEFVQEIDITTITDTLHSTIRFAIRMMILGIPDRVRSFISRVRIFGIAGLLSN